MKTAITAAATAATTTTTTATTRTTATTTATATTGFEEKKGWRYITVLIITNVEQTTASNDIALQCSLMYF